MHQKVVLAIFAAFLQLTAAHQTHEALRCGKAHNNARCAHPMCCSGAGYCGISEEYCSVPGNCQEQFGMCDTFKTPLGASVADGKRKFNVSIPPVVQKCSMPRTLALSFDDGPAQHTNDVLDALAEYGARATFFLGGIINGRGAIDEQWATVVKRMVTEGHQVGSHSWSHPNFDKLTSSARKEQMYKTERAIANVIGKMPTFMRPPMVICNGPCRKDMNDLGYHVVNWQYDSQDWKDPQPSIDQQVSSLTMSMDQIPEDGNMFVIQHDTNPNAAAVARALLRHMKSTWQAVPLVECLGYSLDQAYQFPPYLEYKGAVANGCLVSGPGTCIMPQSFDNKHGCHNTLHLLRDDVRECHESSAKVISSRPIEHCHYGEKVIDDLCSFCHECGEKKKPACNSKNFVRKGAY